MKHPFNETLVDGPHSKDSHAHSPLWMVSQEPLLNELVLYLDTVRKELEQEPDRTHEMRFSRSHLRTCRAAFDRMIIKGEESLHRLCELLCTSYVGPYQLQSVVIGEVPTTSERFTLTQPISSQNLYSTIDLDLGSRQLRKLQYYDGSSWVAPMLVANVVEYQPIEPNRFGINKIISRIKAEEELWNKVVDEIFGLDSFVTRDKELRHLSKYVKDVFGIKIVVGSSSEGLELHHALTKIAWDSKVLSEFGMELDARTEQLNFIETKDYLQETEKGSGWEAIKSVVIWNDKMFEIQIQPLGNFWREREHLTRESHAGFKSRREQVRQQVADQIPLFGFYQSLLKWLFQNPDGPAPIFPAVSLLIID
jgi:ppGpp synthetase/RelA/SpoT-type nucleotidyltranferase